MGALSALFNEDIVLDEEAFQRAAEEFAALSEQLQQLDNEIEEMLQTLQKGFDTPAGRKFVQSCRTNLQRPMEDQKNVLIHISQTLADVREKYKVVFEEYSALNSAVNSYTHKV